MDHLGLFGIAVKTTGDTIRESHADGNKHVALLLLDVWRIVAVHSQHTHIQRMIGRKCRESQQGTSCWDVCFLKEFYQLILGIAQLYAMSDKSQRLLGIVDKLSSYLDSFLIYLWIRDIRADTVGLSRHPFGFLNLGITWKVKYDRTRTATARNIKSTVYRPCDIFCTTDLIAPLCDRLRHTHQVYFLEGVCTQCAYAHLSGDDHDRNGVHHRICYTGKRICGTWTGSDNRHTNLATDTRISLGSMGCALLMADEDMMKPRIFLMGVSIQGIINRHDSTSGITKDRVHILLIQRPHQYL